MSEGTPTLNESRDPCGECHALVAAGEYHPHAFCAMRKAGLDPWGEFRKMALQVGLSDPGATPPKVWEVRS